MNITNLENSPLYRQKTIELIENAFQYNEKNSFVIDFAPLMSLRNAKENNLLINKDELVGHIGHLQRNLTLKNKQYKISMYGGIAINENYRGQGLYSKLFSHTLEQNTDATLHLLWSEKIDLYKKSGFYPALELFEYKKETSPHSFKVISKKLKTLTEEELSEVKGLYLNNELRFDRNEEHWNELKEITSSDLYLIYKGESLVNYFIMNKGQDLINTIHEYGIINDEYLQCFLNYGKVWTPFFSTIKESIILFAALVKIGNTKSFINFVKEYLNISIKQIDQNAITFNFENEEFTVEIEEFLQAILGPGRYTELNSKPKIFISGLDSI